MTEPNALAICTVADLIYIIKRNNPGAPTTSGPCSFCGKGEAQGGHCCDKCAETELRSRLPAGAITSRAEAVCLLEGYVATARDAADAMATRNRLGAQLLDALAGGDKTQMARARLPAGGVLPAPYPHWNDPSVLPPVDCPLAIQVGGVSLRAVRPVPVNQRGDDLQYDLENGERISGKFLWTYP